MSRSAADPGMGPEEITPEGRIAGRTVAVLLTGSAIAVFATSWDDMWARCDELSGTCTQRSAGAVILVGGSVFALFLAVAIWVRIGRRPVHPEGGGRWVWLLALPFLFGCVFATSRIPSFTCSRGRFDELLELCMHPPTTSDPTPWRWLKIVIIVLGFAGAAVIAARPGWVRITAPVTAVVWAVGLGWLLAGTTVG